MTKDVVKQMRGKWYLDDNGTLCCSECKEEALLTLDVIEDITFSESNFAPIVGQKWKELETMHEELLRTLRSCPDAEYGCSMCKYQKSLECRERLMSDAANVIEGLSDLVDRYGGETGIKNLHEYASKYWELLKKVPRWMPLPSAPESPKEET